MATIIDLDRVLPEPKKVTLRGKRYTLPPDVPVELFLRINKANQDGQTDIESTELLYKEVLSLFQDPDYGDPSIESLPLTMGQLLVAISMIYGEKQPEGDAPRPSRAGTRSTSRPRKRKSASSTS